MKLGLTQSARMEQRLIQSPQMIQAMQILQLPGLELQERIEQELMENPFLEVVEPEREDQADSAEAADGDLDPEREALASMLETLESYERDFGDAPASRGTDGDDGDRKLEAMQNTPDRGPTLAEEIIDQYSFLDRDDRHRELAEYIAYSLDPRGYLAEPLDELAAASGVPGATEDDVQQVLDDLREVAHPALGARDLRECLLLQVDALEGLDPLVRTVITDHLDDVTTNRLPRIAKATGRTVEDVVHALEVLRHLDPSPGRDFGDEAAAVITPDVVVEEVEGEYQVRLTRDRHPELRLSSSYRQLLQQAVRGDGVHKWVRKRLESARWFLDAIQQRKSTLLRIATSIFEHQRGYLERGVKGLTPLRMQEVADEAGVHISTVSRAVSGKYAQTPRGIQPLKFFFTSGTTKASGEQTSQTSIKQRLAELVGEEDPSHPLSDDQLAEELAKRDGIRIARRTVTKYRKSLGLPSSSQRRKF